MKLFDFFKGKQPEPETPEKNSYFQTGFSKPLLTATVKEAIRIFIEHPEAESSKMIDSLQVVARDRRLAMALYFFIPEALCRNFVSEVKYPDDFVVSKAGQFITCLYANEVVYDAVAEVCNTRPGLYMAKPTNILDHSATFSALNNALNGGAALNDLELGPCVVSVTE